METPSPKLWCGPLLGAVLLTASCAPSRYGEHADHEVFGILKTKARDVSELAGVRAELGIEAPPPISLEDLDRQGEGPEFLGEAAQREEGARILDLPGALEISIGHSRRYRQEKEIVYLDALEMTLARHELAPIFTGTGEARVNKSRGASSSVSTSATASSVESGINDIVRENTHTRTGSGRFGISDLQRTGLRLAADFTADFLTLVSSGGRKANRSSLLATISQPILRGAGYKATMETLTQAERNVLYSLRDFARFRKEFSVDVAAAYYEVLQARDAARNAFLGYQGFLLNLEREGALAEEDLTSQSELGLLRQASLQSEFQWIGALTEYEEKLDDFKILLGLPVDEQVVLEESELDALRILDPGFGLEEATGIALSNRLDRFNALNFVEDTERRIAVATNGLLPRLDLVGNLDVPSRTGSGFNTPERDRRNWTLGLDVDLPLDSKAERNAYRAALIDREQSLRELSLAEDRIKLDIRNGWRNLQQARKQYEISQLGVELSEDRLKHQKLLFDLGRGIARDLLDAQRDLIESRNQRTAALVGHTLARLRFWRDMGILFIEPDGRWKKILQKEAN